MSNLQLKVLKQQQDKINKSTGLFVCILHPQLQGFSDCRVVVSHGALRFQQPNLFHVVEGQNVLVAVRLHQNMIIISLERETPKQHIYNISDMLI